MDVAAPYNGVVYMLLSLQTCGYTEGTPGPLWSPTTTRPGGTHQEHSNWPSREHLEACCGLPAEEGHWPLSTVVC